MFLTNGKTSVNITVNQNIYRSNGDNIKIKNN